MFHSIIRQHRIKPLCQIVKPFVRTFKSAVHPSEERPEELLELRPEKYSEINVRPQPPITLYMAPKDGITTDELFSPGERVVVFGVPGPFSTGSSTGERVPHFLEESWNILGRKVDMILCISVTDPKLQRMWGTSVDGVLMLCDPEAAFTKHIGMQVDLSALGQGVRSRRYSMIVDNGKVMFFNVESDSSQVLKTSYMVVTDQLDLLDHDVKKRRMSQRDWTHDSLKEELMHVKENEKHLKDELESERPSGHWTKSQF